MITKLLEQLGLNKSSKDTTQSTQVHEHIASHSSQPEHTEKEADSSLYDFKEVTMEDMQKRTDAINDMYTGKADGFLIRNVITQDQVKTLLANIEELRKNVNQLTNVPEGFNYPTVFAEYSIRLNKMSEEQQASEIKKYFEGNEKYNQDFAQRFGVDLPAFVTGFLSKLAGGRKVEVPKGVDEKGSYLFATVRYLVPYQGLMSVHCGNYFGQTFEKFYQHLMTKVATKDQMSYFIMLQEPDEGGELSLFNFRWEDGQTKVDSAEDNEVIQPDGSKVYVQTDPRIRKNKLRPHAGDMILFQGGNIWHRVERIKGTKPRITLGGFLSLSHDGSKVYYWS